MSEFKLHTVESAPEKSKAILEGAQKQMGMVPGLYAVMAESPQTDSDRDRPPGAPAWRVPTIHQRGRAGYPTGWPAAAVRRRSRLENHPRRYASLRALHSSSAPPTATDRIDTGRWFGAPAAPGCRPGPPRPQVARPHHAEPSAPAESELRPHRPDDVGARS